jgi:dolichol-phosphate mannosyltransferase
MPTNSIIRRPLISVVTPVYNEHQGLLEYERRINEALLAASDYEFEIIFVDDGSSDGSWAIINDICERNPAFRGARLSRNHGSHVALSAGFAHARGDAVVTLACDLQDPPEVILDFLSKWQHGAKIVWGRRRTRQDPALRIIASKLLFRLLSRFAMPPDSKFTTGSFLLMDRQVADCFARFQEHNRITFALVAWTGFDQEVVEYDRAQRTVGVSKWSFGRMIKAMYDAFIGFSFVPIRVMTVLGLGISLLALLLLVYLLATWLMGHPVPGWTSQMLALSFFFGIQFLLMGIMGEYLYRIYAEVVRRPLYFVSETTPGGRLTESHDASTD